MESGAAESWSPLNAAYPNKGDLYFITKFSATRLLGCLKICSRKTLRAGIHGDTSIITYRDIQIEVI